MFLPVLLFIIAAVVGLWTLVFVGALLSHLLVWAVMGLITGWIAARLTGARLTAGWTILAGIAGSWVGGVIFSALRLPAMGLLHPLVSLAASVLGAAILITVARIFARPSLTGQSYPRFGRTY
jgi:uncharacterized membrane protein YeaQ/YmgE (transglycosylase-associated protein family)